MVYAHILGGLVGLAAGAVALATRKGGRWHRQSGLWFVYAMLVMSGTGALAAIFKSPNVVNAIAGLLTFYLVVTGYLTVRHDAARLRWLEVGALLAVAMLGLGSIATGVAAGLSGRERVAEMPLPFFFVFGGVALLSAVGDLRWLRHRTPGNQRIVRHLWRLGLALFIAAGSFFLGQADEFPLVVRESGLLPIPVLVVVVLTFFWVVRVRFTRWRWHV